MGCAGLTEMRSTNDVLLLEIAGAGTQYSAQNAGTGSQAAFETLLDGDLWMIYRNVLTDVLHWDFVSAIRTALAIMGKSR